ncbi:AsmA family protein [Azospirillum sp. TSO22-1]|uniref:AsmA family protein n=1 Tax=Azospirillum sp. TSO22-1 TaxID=716789 RepID=UPI001304FB00|nr:AsmA family protein [Azospirillum sp. TSO22-1]
MKKLLIAVAAIVGVVIVVVAALPYVLTGGFIAERLAAAVKERTGRDLSIRFASVSVFPHIRAMVETAALSDVPGSGRPPMLELGASELEIPVWPLLRGTVEVRRLTVDGLRANLLVDAEGRPNWDFGQGGGTQEAGAAQPKSAEPVRLPDTRLGDVRLGNASATYRDERTGQSVQVSDGALTVTMPDLDTPAQVDGSAKVNDRALVLRATVASPRALAEQRPTTVRGEVSSDLFEARLEAGPEADGRTGGPLSVSVPDLRAVAAWLGVPNPQTLPVRSVSLAGKAGLGGRQAALDGLTLALDDIKASGDATADWSGRVPAVTVRASVDPVNLDRFLPPDRGGRSAGWSDEPIDVSALRRANIDAVIESRGLQVRNIKLGPSRTTLRLQDGVLAVETPDLPALGGRTSTAVRIDATRQPAGFALKASADGLRAEQMLATLAGTDRLRGATSLEADLAAAGASQKALVSALNGTARIVLHNGALKGINIAAILRDPIAAATGGQQGAAQETDFAEFGGNFRLENGVAHTADLHMQAPLFRLDGAGAVSLPARTLDLRLNPTAAATVKGQGGRRDLAGVTVPVLVTGTFDSPSIQPDFSAVAASAIGDPAKAADAVRRLKEGASPADILGGLTGSGSSGSPGGRTDGSSDPVGNALKGAPAQIPKGSVEQGLKGLFGR